MAPKLPSDFGLSDRHLRWATRAMQAVVAGVFLAGLVLPNGSLLVNGGVGLAVTLVPAVLRRDYRIQLSPSLVLWITAAVLLHSLGMVGLYESIRWWDHLTHGLSAFLMAGVGYATARALDEHSTAVVFPREFLVLFVVVFTLGFGVLWEVLEFVGRRLAVATGNEPVLIQYGLEDSMLDLVFDVVGALLFALVGTSQWQDVVEAVATRLDERRFSD